MRCAFQNVLHTLTFKLKDRGGLSFAEHFKCRCILLVDLLNGEIRVLPSPLFDEVFRVLNQRQRLEPEEVHLYQTAVFY